MKFTKLLLLSGLCLSTQAVFAQSANSILFHDLVRNSVSAPVLGKATAATGSRLISYVDMQNDGASYVMKDTIHLVYSGTRGGDLFFIMAKFDLGLQWLYNTTTLAWDNKYKAVQTFDANNNIVDRLNQDWSTVTSSWVNTSHDIYTSDANNNMLSDIHQQWNTVTSSWDNDHKDVFTYDGNHNQLTDVYQAWNTVTSTWDNSTKTTNIYNAANKVTQTITQNWNGSTSSWDNNTRTTYTYDANNNELTKVFQNWNGSTSSWDNSSMTTSTYGASNEKLTSIQQTWNGSTTSWDNYKKALYSNFDPLNVTKPQMEIDQNWNTSTSTWDNNKRYQYTYNSYGQYLTLIGDSWNIGGFWQGASGDYSYRFHYEEYATDVKSLTAKGGEANVYPVPANNMLNIDLTWNEPQAFTVSIIDLQGRVSRQWQVAATTAYHKAIDVSQMPFGTYIIKIDGTKGQVVKQLIVSPQ